MKNIVNSKYHFIYVILFTILTYTINCNYLNAQDIKLNTYLLKKNDSELILIHNIQIPDQWKLYSYKKQTFGQSLNINYLNKDIDYNIIWPQDHIEKSIYTNQISYVYQNNISIITKINNKNKVEDIKGEIKYSLCKEQCISNSKQFSVNYNNAINIKENKNYFNNIAINKNILSADNLNIIHEYKNPIINISSLSKELHINNIKINDKNIYFEFNKVDKSNKTEHKILIITENDAFIQNVNLKENHNILLYILKIILYAMIGGLILNFMPCVLPVIIIKIISILKYKELSDSEIKTNLSFTILGILSSFVTLAIIFIIFKNIGLNLGWGFLFQNEYFIKFIILMLVIFFINIFYSGGSFLPKIIMNLITKIEVKYSKKIVNSFISGVLITIFSTPCTAPFLGIALGYAINENIFITFFTFVFIGLGFALPYIIVRLKPSLFFIFQKKYPKFIKIFYPIATISVIFIVIWLMYILTDYWSIEQIIIFLNLLLLLVYIYKADIKNISSFIFKLTIILVILFLPYQGIYNHLIKYLSLLSLLVLISYRILKNNNSNILFYKIFRSFIFITIVILTLISLLYYNNYYLYMILISLLLIVDNLKLNHITKILTVIFFLSLGLYMLVKDDSKKSIIYTSYSQVAIQENVKKGHIVILDITAKWCITCHANFITTFNSEDIKQYFMDNNIKFMRLDITKKNEEINELIKSKGKIGIPLTIIYSLKYPDGKVLNTLLYPEYLIQEIKLHF